MATEDEAREAADETEVQAEAVDLGTVHFQEHPEVKLSSIMEIKNVGETIDSTEGTLKIPEDQVLVEAPSEVELPPEHNLNGKASSLNGHMDKEEKVSNEQPHENDQEEAELDGTGAHQSNGINKEEVTDSLSHGESTTEDSSLLQHEKDEEPKGNDQQDLEGVTVDDDSVQEDTLKTDSAIEQPDDGSLLKHEKDEEPKGNDQQDLEGITVDDDSVQEDTLKTDSAIEQTDDGQQDQNQEPEKANEGTQPASSANNADVEVVAEAPTVLQTPVEPNLDEDEPAKADGVVHPDHNESFPEDTSIAESTEEVVKVEDQRSQQADTTDADVVQEEMLKCEETNVQEEVPKSEHADEPATDAHEMLNQESTEETEGPVDEKIEETEHQSNMAALEETIPEHDITTREPPVNIQVKNQESLEEIEGAEAVDPEAAMQQSSVTFVEAIPEDQHNLGTTVDDDTVQEDTLEAIERTKDGQQDQDVGPEKATENTQPASTANIPDAAVVPEAPTVVHNPVELNLENSDAIPDTTDGNTETDESAKADGVIHPDHKEGFSEDTSIAEPTEEVVKVEDQQSQQADAMDEDMVKEEVPKSEHADAQKLLNQESAEETETPAEINLENSDAIPYTTDGNTETDESAKEDGVMHPNHKEGFSEDTSIAEPTKEVVKVEDQQSQQADAMDEDVVKEEVPISEHADPQELLNQESAEETDGPVNEKTEETEHKGNMAAPEKTAPEHDAQPRDTPVNIQMQNQESLEEIKDAEVEMQESSVTLEETIPEENVATTEPCSEIQHVHHVEPEENNGPGDAKGEEITNKSNTENAVQDDILQSGPTTDIQPVQELEQTESESTGTYEMDEASDQTAAVVVNDLAQEDATETSEPQVTETEELKETEVAEPQEFIEQGYVTSSKELSAEDDSTAYEPHNDDFPQTLEQQSVEVKETISTPEEDTVEDNVTAEDPTCDSQEVDNAESTEEIKGNIAENIVEISDVVIVDRAVEQIGPQTEDVAETHMRELEPEETKNTEPAEIEEPSDQRNAVLFNDSSQADDTPESEMKQTESATETTETEAAPQESNCVSEEHSSEDHMIEIERNCDAQEVSITESSEVTDGDKDIITGGISGQSNMVSAGKSAQENNVPESKPTADIQPVQESEPEETKNTELVEVKDTSHEMDTTVFPIPTEEDNPATVELHESARELSNIEATEVGTPHQSGAAESEGQATEEIASEPQMLEPGPAKEMNDAEAIKPQSISQDNIISTSGESAPEEIATEDNTTTGPDVDQQLQDQESAGFKETEADKPQGIASSSTLSTTEQSTLEDTATATEPSSDTQAENSEPAEVTEGTEIVESTTALAEAAASEEHVETDTTADTSPVQEPDLEETKEAEPAGTQDIMTSRDLPAEKLDMETMETEVVPYESHVTIRNELTEDDNEPVLDLELVEDTKVTDTAEHPGEPHGSPSDEPTPTEENTTVTETAFDTQPVQNMTTQEIKDSEDAKTDESSDLSSFPTPEEADQESSLLRIEPTPDVQQVQELGSTETSRDIESFGTEDHQPHGVSTLEEPAVDSEPNADGQQVHEDKVPELKYNEAMEAEEVAQQSNIVISDNATEERSELRSDPDSYVQPAQQVELSRDSENSQLVKPEETLGQNNAVALEETHTEDSVVSEIPVDIKEEHEQDPVEEIKGIDDNEAEEEFHTSQVDAMQKPAPESNIASIETTYDIKQENELGVTKEINVIEAINQTENATSEDPAPTDNETTPEGHPAELNEETTGNETDNVMLVSGIKDEIQTSLGLKDNACDFGETVLTTQEIENVTDEDAIQSPGDDILETSNNTDQVKEDQKDGCEHNSSEMKGVQNKENITHVQDRDISGELLTKRGTEEASQALFGSDPQEAQDVTKKDDTTEGGEQTSDLNSQPDDVALQLQTCEAGAFSIARQDEVVQKVDLDQQNKEDEIESQKEELQTNEQKHEDKVDDFTMEPLVEPEDIENGPIDGTEDTDACEAEQTEAVITETIKHKEAPHVSEDSTPISTDMKVDNITGTNERTAEDGDAKNDNKDEQESAERDDIVPKNSTHEQDETTDEITNEELKPDLASSGQEASDPAPSNDDILHNDPASITQNVESGEHREDKECTYKVNDDVHAIQASEEEIADEIEENKEKQNEDNAIRHDESLTKPEEEEAPQLHSNEPCNVNAKIDDKTTLGEEIIHGNASIKPREIEEIGENKGLDSTSEPFVESSIQNNAEKGLSSHHKIEDEKLSMTEQNAVDIEAMQEKADASTSDINQTKQCQEEIITDVQLKVEGNSFDKIDETVSHEKTETGTTEAVTVNDNITDKASEADDGPSDGSLQTFNDTGRNLDVSSVIAASKEESVNENMEDHKLALPAHTAQDENTLEQVPCIEKTEREMPSSEKLLPTEPEENQIPSESNEEESQDENQIPNDKNEEDKQDTDIGDAQKEVEQDLPASHFLMNLILGQKNSDVNENSEPEAERKQEKTTEDDSCVLISKQEESLGSLPTENKVDDNLTCEQEKHDVKCSEETQEMVKEQSDEEFNKNTSGLEIAAYQGNPQDNISGELLSEAAASVSTKMENRDTEISNLKLDDRAVDTVCQEKTEASTKIENGSLKNNINNLTNTKASGEDNLGEGQIGLLQSLPEDENADAVSEQTPLLTESGKIDAKDLCCDVESVQNLACAKEDEPTESSIIEATSTPDIRLECEEVEKKEEEQHASTATGQVSEEDVEGLNDNIQKSTSSEVTTDEQAPQITKPVSDTEKILAHEKGIYEGSTCMDEKENSNFSNKGAENFQTAIEIQADGLNMEINQDKKDEVADNKTAMEPEKLADGPTMQINQDKKDEVADNKTAMEPEKLGESDFQEHQETDAEQKSPIATDEGDQQLETMIKEQVVPGTVESHEQTMSIKSNEEQQLFDSKVQERDLNVVSPREASEAEENFVDGTKPVFGTDEEQSPKADPEEKTYDEKVKDVEGTKNFTDGAAMKTEAPGATQKAHKKHNLLSGVGSKVKHQLAKVKKAIIGKPGHTKPDSPKS